LTADRVIAWTFAVAFKLVRRTIQKMLRPPKEPSTNFSRMPTLLSSCRNLCEPLSWSFSLAGCARRWLSLPELKSDSIRNFQCLKTRTCWITLA
jgi:hypothetical protein